MTTRFINRTLISALLLLFTALPASAAVMIETKDLIFKYDDTSLFGELYVTSYDDNNVAFKPTDFDVGCSGVGCFNDIDDTIIVEIWVKEDSDFDIGGVRITEKGDYYVGLPNGTDGLNSVRSTLFSSVVGHTDSDIFFEANATNPEELDFYKLATMHDIEGSVSHLLLQIENVLFAQTNEAAVGSFIDKKLVRISVKPVPVPAAVWLFGSVLATLGLFRKRAEAAA